MREDTFMEITEVQREVEAVSAHYAERHNTSRIGDWFVLKLREEIGELTQAYLARAGQVCHKGRSDGKLEQDFRSDLGDVFAQVPLIPERFDLDRPIASKWLVWKSEIENAIQ
jgi:NTP pyrophosphatase (non-canonical NTP hydrolase)